MAKWIFARVNDEARLYSSVERFIRSTFSPDDIIEAVIPLRVTGNTYKERQENARALAIEVQCADKGGLSYGEYAILHGFFENVGRRLGLLKEFRENAIC